MICFPGGSMGMHPVWQGMQYIRESSKAFFRTLDATVVKFGDYVPFPTPIHGQHHPHHRPCIILSPATYHPITYIPLPTPVPA